MFSSALYTRNKLNHIIPEIFEHLFSTYDDLTQNEPQELMPRVESLILSLPKPFDNIFSEIDNQAAIVKITNALMTAT